MNNIEEIIAPNLNIINAILNLLEDYFPNNYPSIQDGNEDFIETEVDFTDFDKKLRKILNEDSTKEGNYGVLVSIYEINMEDKYIRNLIKEFLPQVFCGDYNNFDFMDSKKLVSNLLKKEVLTSQEASLIFTNIDCEKVDINLNYVLSFFVNLEKEKKEDIDDLLWLIFQKNKDLTSSEKRLEFYISTFFKNKVSAYLLLKEVDNPEYFDNEEWVCLKKHINEKYDEFTKKQDNLK